MAFHPWPWMVYGSSIPGQAWSMDGPGMAIATFIPGLETKSPESSKQLTEAPFFEILSRL